ncbi:Protein-glutamate methylesterase/protein-glutamine glutaminase [Streptomyces badius]
MSLGFSLPLLWRRTHPLPVLLLMAPISVVNIWTGAVVQASLLQLIPVFQIVLRCSFRTVGAAALVFVVPVLSGGVRIPATWGQEVVSYVWGLVFVILLGIAVRTRREYTEALVERAHRLERERDQQARLAAADERTRIAREMHDIIGHNLSVITGLADGGAYAAGKNPERAGQALEAIGTTSRQALSELRRLLGVLRDDHPDAERTPQPTLDELAPLIERVRGAGLPVHLELTGSPTPHALTPGRQLTVYRVVQEALTNTLKHATAPTSATVTLTYSRTHLEARITDTGTGVGRAAETEETAGSPGHHGHARTRSTVRRLPRSGAASGPHRMAGTAPPSPGGIALVTTVLIADDQPMQRFGFRMLLESQDDMTVVGEASNGTEAVHMVARHHPDVVLMDIRMPGLDGIEATRRVIASGARTRILIVTTFDLDEYAYDGLRAGASGFLVKDALPEELLAGIRAVAAGDAVVAPTLTHRLLDAYVHHLPVVPGTRVTSDPRITALTEREREILTVIGQGWSNTEIAARLHLAESTVKTHVTRILAKTGARDRVQAVILAYDTRLVTPL